MASCGSPVYVRIDTIVFRPCKKRLYNCPQLQKSNWCYERILRSDRVKLLLLHPIYPKHPDNMATAPLLLHFPHCPSICMLGCSSNQKEEVCKTLYLNTDTFKLHKINKIRSWNHQLKYHKRKAQNINRHLDCLFSESLQCGWAWWLSW